MAFITGTTTATDGHVQVAQALYDHLVNTLNWTPTVPFTYGIRKSKVYPINSGGTTVADAYKAIDRDDDTYVTISDNGYEGAFEMEFDAAVNLTGFYTLRADELNFEVEYWDGASWISVYTGINTSPIPQEQKHIWTTGASSTRWRLHWLDLPSYSGTADFRANTWQFYTGPAHDGYVPSNTAAYELHAPGIAGYTSPYVEFSLREEAVAGYYNLTYRVGVNVSGTPGNMSRWQAIRLTDSVPIVYWIGATAWSCVIAAKIGGVFDSGVFGLLTPYSPAQFYPFTGVCGGSTYNILEPGTSESNVRPWFDPWISGDNSPLYICNPYGLWLRGYNTESSWGNSSYARVNPHFSYVNKFGTTNLKQAPDGTVVLLPIVAMNEDPNGGPNVFGEIEGALFTPGLEAHSETIATVDGVDYMIFQFAHYTDASRFFALRMN